MAAKKKELQKKNTPVVKEENLKITSSPLQKSNSVSPILWALLVISASALFLSVFKNISYPLFWADESMTVVGGQRVLEFGYPKVHDGKNVFYDLRHSNPKLGIDEKTDAFIGGSNWGHYYFAAIAVKLAEFTSDIYSKTGIIRSFFALLGVLGISMLGFASTRYFESKSSKILVFIMLFALSAFSVGLGLHIREVRYYPLVIFIFGILFYLFSEFVILKKIHIFIYLPVMTISLFVLFITFSPAFFIFYLATTLFVATKIIIELNSGPKKQIAEIIKEIGLVSIPYLIALGIAFPLIGYFKTFEINEAMAAFNGYSDKMYWDNFSNLWKYFSGNSILYLAILAKIGTLVFFNKIIKNQSFITKLYFSSFITIFFICFIYSICRVPNYLFTRYFIVTEPLLFAAFTFDTLYVSTLIFDQKKSQQTIAVSLILTFGLIFQISKNSNLISKRYYELTHKYEGGLDAVIPYIQSNYKDTKSLVIATNYEETTYMYYLDSKVTIGFVGNNLEEDKKVQPDIIQYRKSWGTDPSAFSSFLQNGKYQRISFPIRDNFTNNNPELIFPNILLNHQFKTLTETNEQNSIELYIKEN